MASIKKEDISRQLNEKLYELKLIKQEIEMLERLLSKAEKKEDIAKRYTVVCPNCKNTGSLLEKEFDDKFESFDENIRELEYMEEDVINSGGKRYGYVVNRYAMCKCLECEQVFKLIKGLQKYNRYFDKERIWWEE